MKITKNTKIREVLQIVGTELMRDRLHPEVWVNSLFADYKSCPVVDKTFMCKDCFDKGISCQQPKWILTDMRFPNELKAVEDRGGITIRVNRDWRFIEGLKTVNNPIPLNLQHPSETSLDSATFKYTIDNNGTLEELIEKVKTILIAEKII